jgi:hypothetical protein
VRKPLVLIAIVVSFVACKKAANMAKYKERAMALAAKYSPKVAELSKRLPELTAHAKDLPVNVPGADKLNTLLAENKSTVEEAQKVLADLPNRIAKDSPEQAEKELADAEKVLDKDVATAEKDEAEEAQIETAAAAPASAPPAAPGSAATAPPAKK